MLQDGWAKTRAAAGEFCSTAGRRWSIEATMEQSGPVGSGEVWQETVLPEGMIAHWSCGSSHLRVLKRGHDWLVGADPTVPDHELGVSIRFEEDTGGSCSGCQRWAFDRPVWRFRVRPLPPDRPVVVRPMDPLHLPTGATVVFYVSIPLRMEVLVVEGEGRETALGAYLAHPVSSIWYGDPMSGVLGYSLKSRALRELDGSPTVPHRAVCPVRIRNSCDKALAIDKFCLHVSYLGVFLDRHRLWTHPVLLEHQGPDKPIRLEYSKQAPAEAESPRLLADPPSRPDGKLFSKSFLADTFRLL